MKDLLIPAFTSLGVTLAGLWVAARFLGEKLFGHWLDGRLLRQKEAHEVRLAELKSEQDRQIEKLRGDIGYQQDRGKRSNEREYAALTEIWEKFADLHEATNSCVMGGLQFPDLQRMNGDEIAKFLNKNDFTEEERDTVQNAANKNDGFSLVMNVRLGARARRAYWDFRARFDKQNVSIPSWLADSFGEAADRCLRVLFMRNPGDAGLTNWIF